MLGALEGRGSGGRRGRIGHAMGWGLVQGLGEELTRVMGCLLCSGEVFGLCWLTVHLLEHALNGAGAAAAGHGDVELVVVVGHVVCICVGAGGSEEFGRFGSVIDRSQVIRKLLEEDVAGGVTGVFGFIVSERKRFGTE